MADSIRQFVKDALKGFYRRLPLKKISVNGGVINPDSNGTVDLDILWESGSGDYSIENIYGSSASGNYSLAEGESTLAKGEASHAEGGFTDASGNFSHAEGYHTTANGLNSHSEGNSTISIGNNSHAEGTSSISSGISSHAEGDITNSVGDGSHSEGIGDRIETHFTVSSTGSPHLTYITSEDNNFTVGVVLKYGDGTAVVSEIINERTFKVDRTLGNLTDAYLECIYGVAYGNASHSEGNYTSAIGNNSHAEGIQSHAIGNNSHSEGRYTEAIGESSHAEGDYTDATGEASHAEGSSTQATNKYEHAEGRFNKSNKNSSTYPDKNNTIHSIGIGTSSSDRKNAFEVMQDGSVYVYGLGGYTGKNPGSSQTLQEVIAGGENIHPDWIAEETDPAGILNKPYVITGDGIQSIIENDLDNDASGNYSHAEGRGTSAEGNNSHSEGRLSYAKGENSHAEGYNTYSFASHAHSEGYGAEIASNTADGGNFVVSGPGETTGVYTASSSHGLVFGDVIMYDGTYTTVSNVLSPTTFNTSNPLWTGTKTGQVIKIIKGVASGAASHSEGSSTTASGRYSHSEGYLTVASGHSSHAEGRETTAGNSYTHTEGYNTTAQNSAEHAEGRSNVSHTGSTSAEKTIHSIGIGTTSIPRNAVEVMDNGDMYLYDAGSYDGTNPSTAKRVQDILNDAENGANVLLPNFDNMTPIRTFTMNLTDANNYMLFSRSNVITDTDTMASVNDIVMFRVTTTGDVGANKVYCVTDFVVRFRPELMYPLVIAENRNHTNSEHYTGIYIIRFQYPKAVNNGYDWICDFRGYAPQSYAKNYKIEVFADTENITWYESKQLTTYNTSYQSDGSVTIFDRRGIISNGTAYVNAVSATTSQCTTGWHNKYLNSNILRAGESMVSGCMVYASDYRVYNISNKNYPIDVDFGVNTIGATYAANYPQIGTAIAYNNLRNQAGLTISQQAVYGTDFVVDPFNIGDRMYLQCRLQNGMIYSDAHITTEMTPGHTWYMLGAAFSETQLSMNTFGSFFITLDDNGQVTHINGKPISGALSGKGLTYTNTGKLESQFDTSYSKLKKVLGRSIVYNQNADSTNQNAYSAFNVTFSISSASGEVTMTPSSASGFVAIKVPILKNHYYYWTAEINTTAAQNQIMMNDHGRGYVCWNLYKPNEWQRWDHLFKMTGNDVNQFQFRIYDSRTGARDAIKLRNICCFDLTRMFGSGNEVDSIDAMKRMLSYESGYTYNTGGSLINANCSEFDTTYPDGTALDSLAIDLTDMLFVESGGTASRAYFSDGLNGIGDVCDEVDFENASATKRIGRTTVGSLTWTKQSGNTFYATVSDMKSVSSTTVLPKVLTNTYLTAAYGSGVTTNKTIGCSGNKIYVCDTSYSTADSFKSAMANEVILYELETPVEYEMDQQTAPEVTYRTSVGGHEYWKTSGTVSSDGSIKPNNVTPDWETRYRDPIESVPVLTLTSTEGTLTESQIEMVSDRNCVIVLDGEYYYKNFDNGSGGIEYVCNYITTFSEDDSPFTNIGQATLEIDTNTGEYYLDSHTVPSEKVFWVEYGVTEYSDVYEAWSSGLLVACMYQNKVYICNSIDVRQNSRLTFSNVSQFINREISVERNLLATTWSGPVVYKYEDVDNRIVTISNASTDAEYPSAKAVYRALPVASDSSPVMDGDASAGVSATYSRGDHVHPSDTSRVPTSRKINNHPLTADITLTASDVGALPSSTVIPTVGSLNTNNTGAQQVPQTAESFSLDISLHKISKTGNYGDLIDAPAIKKGTGSSAIIEGMITSGTSLNVASGNYSHAEGCCTKATNSQAHAEGYTTTASGQHSHSEGYNTSAAGNQSHAEGLGTETKNWSEHAEGEYNLSGNGSSNATKTIHSVGIGTSSSARKNALDIRRNGDIYIDRVGNYNGTGTVSTLQQVLANLENAGANFVRYDDVLQPTNPFGGKKLYINSIDNAFYAADKRFWVKVTTHSKTVNGVNYPYFDENKTVADPDYWVDSPVVSTISTANVSHLFDGNYESYAICPVGQYMKIHIQFAPFSDSWDPSTTTASFSGYPHGSYFLNYYNNDINSTKRSQLRIYNKHASWTIGWNMQEATVYHINAANTAELIEEFVQTGFYTRTCVEFIIYGNDSGNAVWPTQVDYKLSRPNLSRDGSTVTKYGKQSLYYDFEWYNHTDNDALDKTISLSASTGEITANKFKTKNGTSSQFVKGDGSLDSSSYATTASLADYLPLAGGTMSGAIKRYYSAASTDPMISLTSNAKDTWLWRINNGSSASVATSGVYGFGLKYKGTGSGVNKTLSLYADNQTGSQVEAVKIDQTGKTTLVEQITAKKFIKTEGDGTNVLLDNGNTALLSNLTNGVLDTTQTSPQQTSSNESFGGTVKLHKISKTGSYNDLGDKPTIPTVPTLTGGDGISVTGTSSKTIAIDLASSPGGLGFSGGKLLLNAASSSAAGYMSSTDYNKINFQLIPDESDLNNYTTEGCYYVGGGSAGSDSQASLSHTPYGSYGGFSLFVLRNGRNNSDSWYRLQIYSQNNGCMWQRSLVAVVSGSTTTQYWRDWAPITPITIDNGADLNNFTMTGIYVCSNDTWASGASNKPSGLNKSFKLEVISNSTADTSGHPVSPTQVYQRLTTREASGFKRYDRNYSDSTWGDWNQWYVSLADVQSDWEETVTTAADYIDKKPSIKRGGPSTSSIIEGNLDNNTASGTYSHAEGNSTSAVGIASHAEGRQSTANGNYAHAEGYKTATFGNYAHAEGYATSAYGDDSHAEGAGEIYEVKITGPLSGTTSNYTVTCSNPDDNYALRQYDRIQYPATLTSNIYTVLEVIDSTTVRLENAISGTLSDADAYLRRGQAIGNHSHSEGNRNNAYGQFSHAEGGYNTAIGAGSHVEGRFSKATISSNHAEGYMTSATGGNSDYVATYGAHSEGNQTTASGYVSHAEGYMTTASGGITSYPSSHAEGNQTTASGNVSHAEGYNTVASSFASHAEGGYTQTNNQYEHAQGKYNSSRTGSTDADKTMHSIGIGTGSTARMNAVEVMLNGDVYINGVGNYNGSGTVKSLQTVLSEINTSATTKPDWEATSGAANEILNEPAIRKGGNNTGSIIEGNYSSNNAPGTYSHAEGNNTRANGSSSHAEGSGTIAYGEYSHAEGYNTKAYTSYAHAEGYGVTACAGDYSAHAEGYHNPNSASDGDISIVGVTGTGEQSSSSTFPYTATSTEGLEVGDVLRSEIDGAIRHAVVRQVSSTTAFTTYSTLGALSNATITLVRGVAMTNAHCEGRATVASGNRSHAEGYKTKAFGANAHVEGNACKTMSNNAHAEGDSTKASNTAAHSEGGSTTASGQYSHAEGYNTVASGYHSHAEGSGTTASGGSSTYPSSHAEGMNTVASGGTSHAEGYYANAVAFGSHVEGCYTKTTSGNNYEHAQGRYNASHNKSTNWGDPGNTLHSIGIGTGSSDSNRKNAVEVMQSGDVYLFNVGGYNGNNPNTTNISSLQEYVTYNGVYKVSNQSVTPPVSVDGVGIYTGNIPSSITSYFEGLKVIYDLGTTPGNAGSMAINLNSIGDASIYDNEGVKVDVSLLMNLGITMLMYSTSIETASSTVSGFQIVNDCEGGLDYYGGRKFLRLSGGTMTGQIAMGNNKITGLATPTSANDATNKSYVDQSINGALNTVTDPDVLLSAIPGNVPNVVARCDPNTTTPYYMRLSTAMEPNTMIHIFVYNSRESSSSGINTYNASTKTFAINKRFCGGKTGTTNGTEYDYLWFNGEPIYIGPNGNGGSAYAFSDDYISVTVPSRGFVELSIYYNVFTISGQQYSRTIIKCE